MDKAASNFDWALYGLLIRKARTDMGYRKAEHFAASIWRRTRIEVSRDTLYKIEQGKQAPTAEQFMALNMILFSSPFPENIFGLCSSNEWKTIRTGCTDDIPNDWKCVNHIEALREAKQKQAEWEKEHGRDPFIAHLDGLELERYLVNRWANEPADLFEELHF